MRALRIVSGMGAVLAAAGVLNLAVWAPRPVPILLLGGAAVLLGALWLGMSLLASGGGARLQGRAVGGLKAVANSLLFLGICIMLYLFAQHAGFSRDLSREGRRELAPQTVQVLESMADTVEVLCFFLDVDNELVTIAREKTLRFLDQCKAHTDLLEVRVVDPQINRVSLQEMGVTHLSPQGTVLVKAGARQKVIWFTGGSPRLEEADFTNALIGVLRDTEPRIGFLTGHGERRLDDEDEAEGASLLFQFLLGESYQLEPVAISLQRPVISSEYRAIIMMRPQSDVQDAEIEALDAYVEEGGRVLVLLEPWTLAQLPDQARRLRGWLAQRFGIEVTPNLVAAAPEERGLLEGRQNPLLVQLSADPGPFAELAEPPGEFRGSYSIEHPLTRVFDQVMLLQAAGAVRPAAQAPSGVSARTILRTPPNYYEVQDLDDLSARRLAAGPGPGAAMGPVPLAVAATRRTGAEIGDTGRMREARALVVGNERFASNAELATGPGGHLNFLLNAVAWLTENEELIALRPRARVNPPLVLSAAQQRAVIWVTTLLTLQAVLLAGGAVYLVRRRNR